MKRRVFTILSAVSLGLAVVIAGLWVRSYWFGDSAHLAVANYQYQILSFKGRAIFAQSEVADLGFPINGVGSMAATDLQTGEPSELFKISVHQAPRDLGLSGWLVVFPLWVSMLVFMVMPALWFFRRSSRRREKLACFSCGYDLRASKDKCPECGAAISANA